MKLNPHLPAFGLLRTQAVTPALARDVGQLMQQKS
jgi:hypothetical protein